MTDAPLTPPKAPPLPTYKMPPPVFLKHRGQFSDEELKPILEGKLELPNFEPLPLWRVVRSVIGFYGTRVDGYALLPGEGHGLPIYDGTHSWSRAIFFLEHGQFRGPNGKGYVLVSHGYANDETSVIAGSFAVCEHKHVEDPGANHQRGWHPSHCELCGLNTSVDSGD